MAAPAPAPPANAPEPNPPHPVFIEQLFVNPAPPLRPEITLLCRALFCGLILFLIASTFSAIMWIIFHPTFPSIYIPSASISPLTFPTNNSVTASLNLTLLLTNPNRHLNTLFLRTEISLIYSSRDVLISQAYPDQFVQRRKSKYELETALDFYGAEVGVETVEDIKKELGRGSLGFGVKVFAIVKYKNGKWKTRSQIVRASCDGVRFGFVKVDKPGVFLNPYLDCVVYMYST